MSKPDSRFVLSMEKNTLNVDQQSPESQQAMWDEMAAEDSPVMQSQASAQTDQGAAFSDSLESAQESIGAGKTEGPTASETNAADPPKVETQDPFKDLPEAVKQRLLKIDEIEKVNQQLADQLRTNTGRVSSLQSEWDLAKKAPAQAANAPSQEQIQDASKSPEKWRKLKADFEEWGEGIEEFVRSELNNFRTQNSPNPGIDPNQIASVIESRVEEKLEKAKLEFKHENWLEVVNTPEFSAWMHSQPDEVKSLADSPRARDASRMLDLFNSAKQQNIDEIKKQRSARLEVAALQKGPSAPQPKTVEEMTDEELWNYEARLLEKRNAS